MKFYSVAPTLTNRHGKIAENWGFLETRTWGLRPGAGSKKPQFSAICCCGL